MRQFSPPTSIAPLPASPASGTGRSRRRILGASPLAARLLGGSLFLLAAQVGPAAAQGSCETSQVILNTGYDHANAAVLPFGAIDTRWKVVQDPLASTNEPRPATVIPKNIAWQNPEPFSQWISGYPSSVQTQNGAYVFETVFCLKPGIDLNDPASILQLGMRADDACNAFLNGNTTSFHTGQVFSSATMTVSSYNLGSIGAVVGKNTLRIQVDNISKVAMGLNLVATVFAEPNNTAEKPECCCPYGALQGLKYNDKNGNGVRDSGEQGLSGWTINLSGSNGTSLSAVTDSTGFYSFVDLLPATYTLTETQQSGWKQTAPALGSHILTLAALEGVAGLDFGNTFCTTGQVLLNTGYDHLGSGVLAVGDTDPRWTVVQDPILGTTEPRFATVIGAHAGWQPAETDSQWISGFPTSWQGQNGAYVFETVFCLEDTLDLNDPGALLQIGMRADDACSAFLNGGSAFHVGQTFNAASMTVSSYNLGSIGAVVGKNTLRIQVDNIQSVALGLDLVAKVFAPGNTAKKPICCCFPVASFNKEMINNSAVAADEVVIHALNPYAPGDIKSHVDPLGSTFTATLVGGGTDFRWSGMNVPSGAAIQVGVEVYGAPMTYASVSWLWNGVRVGCGRQVNSHYNPINGGVKRVEHTNDVLACEAVTLYVGELSVEYYDDPPALEELNPTGVRTPLAVHVIPDPTQALAAGASTSVLVPDPPAAARYVLLVFKVGTSPTLTPPDLTLDFVLQPIEPAFPSTMTPAPGSYCTAGTSASGCKAVLSGTGVPSATASSGFSLTGALVEGQKDGLFFFGTNGRQANSWGNGTSLQCVTPPVKRAGVLPGTGTNGLCDGAFVQDLNALWCPTCPKPLHNPGAGALVQAQLWYRDPMNTSNQTTSLSDAVEFSVGP